MEWIAGVALGFMGLTLGLVGAGGSILTIPILVYLLGIPLLVATSYSLFLVGSTALVAAIRYRARIRFFKSLLFIVPSVVGVFGSRRFLVPHLPGTLGSIPMDQALVALLLCLMGLSSYFLINNRAYPIHDPSGALPSKWLKIIGIASLLGTTMGLLGAGGGFLIVPALVVLMGFSMTEAVPTSLFIITLNSFVGFVADTHTFLLSDWMRLFQYLGAALLGMLTGLYWETGFRAEHLKKLLGYGIGVVATVIFTREFVM